MASDTPMADPQPPAAAPRSSAGSLRRMNSNAPSQKITVAALAGAIVQVLVWWNATNGGPDIPEHVVGGITVLVAFAVGYVVPPRASEAIINVQRAE